MHHNFVRLLTVYVENLFGDERLTVRISEDATIEDLRSTVVEPAKSSAGGGGGDNQIFLYNDTPLSDETRTLKSYDVEDGAVLTIVPHMKTGPRRRDVDRAAIRRATQSIQREAVELMKCVTVTTGGRSGANSTTEEDEIYAVESTPDNRLRLVKYGPKTAPTKKTCDDKNDEEKEKMDEKNEQQRNRDEQAKILREKINSIRQKLKKRSSESSPSTTTKSRKSPTTSSSKEADKSRTTKLEKKGSTKGDDQKTKEIKVHINCKKTDNSSEKKEEEQHEL